jgi:hypothetical protein
MSASSCRITTGRTPSARRARATVITASPVSCTTSANAYHGASSHAGVCASASTSTSAGATLGGGKWQPTLPFPVLASLLPLLPGEMTPVQFRFTPVGGGTWQIDDVYVDPWRYK